MKRKDDTPIRKDLRANIETDPEYARAFFEGLSNETLSEGNASE